MLFTDVFILVTLTCWSVLT